MDARRRVAPSSYRELLKAAKKQEAPATQVTKEPPVPGLWAGTSRPQPPPAPDRRALVVAAAAVTMLVVAGAAVALVSAAGGDNDEADPPLEAVATVSTTAGSETTPGAGGDGMLPSEVVQVVDHGWYVNDDQVGSYGFVVENTSDDKLGPFLVRVMGYDRSGAVISGLDDWTHIVGMMQPREKVGIADLLDNDQAHNGISRLEFAVVEVSSDPMRGIPIPESIPDGEIQVGNVELDGDHTRTVVSYEATSSFAETFEGKAYLLFRDDAGRIVGGTSSFIDLPAHATAGGDFELDALNVPPEMVDMEVYVVPSLTFDFPSAP